MAIPMHCDISAITACETAKIENVLSHARIWVARLIAAKFGKPQTEAAGSARGGQRQVYHGFPFCQSLP